jgi:hypothetical protein
MPFPAEDNEELVYQVTKAPIAPLREYASTLPSGFDAVVARCMERDKARRFASVADLARALAPYAPGNPTPSLERIALLGPEAEEGGTEVMPGAQRVYAAPVSHHPQSRPTPISRNTPRSVPAVPNPASPWSAVASQPLPQIVPADPPREERATAYLAIAAGLVVIVGVGVAMWRIRPPKAQLKARLVVLFLTWVGGLGLAWIASWRFISLADGQTAIGFAYFCILYWECQIQMGQSSA